jgi:hypothetical protein
MSWDRSGAMIEFSSSRRSIREISSMRGTTLSMCFLLILAPFPSRSDEPRQRPSDATLGAKPPAGAIVLVGEKTPEGWVQAGNKTPAKWPSHDGVLTVGHGDIMTERSFGSFELHVEFNVPYMPSAHGQGRGNSGIFLTGNHELQVLDSYGLKSQNNDCGAIYHQIAPAVNACKPPLQWQTYDVTFHKAQIVGGKLVKKARVTVVQNGIKIIDDAEISPTPGGTESREGQDGPLLLQDHGNLVEYRNIWIMPID